MAEAFLTSEEKYFEDVYIYIYYYSEPIFLRTANLYETIYQQYTKNIQKFPATFDNVNVLISERSPTDRIIVHYVGYSRVSKNLSLGRCSLIRLCNNITFDLERLYHGSFNNMTLIFDYNNDCPRSEKNERLQKTNFDSVNLLLKWSGYNVISPKIGYYVRGKYTIFSIAFEEMMSGRFDNFEHALENLDMILKGYYNEYGIAYDQKKSLIKSQ